MGWFDCISIYLELQCNTLIPHHMSKEKRIVKVKGISVHELIG